MLAVSHEFSHPHDENATDTRADGEYRRELGGFEDSVSALLGALTWLAVSYVAAQAELLGWPLAVLLGAAIGLGVQWLLACPLRLLLTGLRVLLPLLVASAVLAILL